MLELKPKSCLGIPHSSTSTRLRSPGPGGELRLFSLSSCTGFLRCSPYGPMVVIIPISHKMSHKHPDMVPNICKPPYSIMIFLGGV